MASIHGGMQFRQGRPIRLPPPPENLPAQRIRLRCPGRPEVIAGQVVRQGQVLLEPSQADRACYVSPLTGTVREVTQANADSVRPSDYHVTIEPSLQEMATALPIEAPVGRKLDHWLSVMRQTGPWADCDGGVGLLPQLQAAREQKIDTVICVGLDAFPPYPDRSSLLVSFPEDVVRGTLIVADLIGAGRAVTLGSKRASVLGRLRPSCRNFKVELRPVTNIYPSADPTLVAWSQADGRRLPHGANPATCGLLMITPWTAIRIARWVARNKLDVVRPIMIAWPDAGAPMTLTYALAGQPLASLDPKLAAALGDPHTTVVFGNPMTGRKVSESHVHTPTSNVSPAATPIPQPEPLALPADELLISVLPGVGVPSSAPCISCGWCADVCPTSLRPYHLMELALRGSHDHTLAEQLDWCVDCGLCSHVCPVSLPLTQTLRAAAAGQG